MTKPGRSVDSLSIAGVDPDGQAVAVTRVPAVSDGRDSSAAASAWFERPRASRARTTVGPAIERVVNRDDDVIKAADEKGLAMVFTGMRHFRH